MDSLHSQQKVRFHFNYQNIEQEGAVVHALWGVAEETVFVQPQEETALVRPDSSFPIPMEGAEKTEPGCS